MGLKSDVFLLAVVVISAMAFPTVSILGAQGKVALPYSVILITPDRLCAYDMHTYGHPYPDMPLIGEDIVPVRYGGISKSASEEAQGADADYVVRFKHRPLSFPIDRNRYQEEWVTLGNPVTRSQ